MSSEMDEAMARLAVIETMQSFERDRRRTMDLVEQWRNNERAEAWHEGYGHGRDDQEAETRTNQMHVTLNPYRKAQTND